MACFIDFNRTPLEPASKGQYISQIVKNRRFVISEQFAITSIILVFLVYLLRVHPTTFHIHVPKVLNLSDFCWPKKAGSKEVLQKSDQPFGHKLLSKLLRPRLSCWEVLNSSGNYHLQIFISFMDSTQISQKMVSDKLSITFIF